MTRSVRLASALLLATTVCPTTNGAGPGCFASAKPKSSSTELLGQLERAASSRPQAEIPAPATSLTYRFDEVKSKVLRAPSGDASNEVKVSAGESAQGGDVVRTGFWGKAILSVPERRTRFQLAGSTKARLASSEPGVLLVLEKGRLEAAFDALTGGDDVERRVAAPGALLAVRGTRYGLEVEGDETLLVVFEGVVEVLPTTAGIPPLRVRPEEACFFGRGAPPRSGPMRSMGMSPGRWGLREGQRSRGGPEGGGSGGRGDGGPGGPGQPGAAPGGGQHGMGPGPGSMGPPAQKPGGSPGGGKGN